MQRSFVDHGSITPYLISIVYEDEEEGSAYIESPPNALP